MRESIPFVPSPEMCESSGHLGQFRPPTGEELAAMSAGAGQEPFGADLAIRLPEAKDDEWTNPHDTGQKSDGSYDDHTKY